MRKKDLRISSLFYFQPRTAEGKSMTKEAKTTRNLKVIEQSGYRYQATPTVMLKGKWLSELGFDIGTHVKVRICTACITRKAIRRKRSRR